MLKVRLSAVFASRSLLFAKDAMADGFSLTAANSATNLSATLTGTLSSTLDVYDMTSMAGMVDGQIVALLATLGPVIVRTPSVVNGWEILYDNLLSQNSPYVDYHGLAFIAADGTLGNLYHSKRYLYTKLGGKTQPSSFQTLESCYATASTRGAHLAH